MDFQVKGYGRSWPQRVSQREKSEAGGREAEQLPGLPGSSLSLWNQSMPRAACLQSNSKANTGETGKNSSCNLILSIYLLPQGVTGDSGTCVLQQFLEVGRLCNSLQGNIAGDLSRRPTIWRGLLPCVSVKIWGSREWTEWLPWFMLPRVPPHLPKTKHFP